MKQACYHSTTGTARHQTPIQHNLLHNDPYFNTNHSNMEFTSVANLVACLCDSISPHTPQQSCIGMHKQLTLQNSACPGIYANALDWFAIPLHCSTICCHKLIAVPTKFHRTHNVTTLMKQPSLKIVAAAILLLDWFAIPLHRHMLLNSLIAVPSKVALFRVWLYPVNRWPHEQ